MKEEKPTKSRELGDALRTGGVALGIPAALVGPPVVLGFLGSLLADRWDQPWITLAGVLVGLILGIWECVHLLKRIISSS